MIRLNGRMGSCVDKRCGNGNWELGMSLIQSRPGVLRTLVHNWRLDTAKTLESPSSEIKKKIGVSFSHLITAILVLATTSTKGQ
jgi:hypothetical protein